MVSAQIRRDVLDCWSRDVALSVDLHFTTPPALCAQASLGAVTIIRFKPKPKSKEMPKQLIYFFLNPKPNCFFSGMKRKRRKIFIIIIIEIPSLLRTICRDGFAV